MEDTKKCFIRAAICDSMKSRKREGVEVEEDGEKWSPRGKSPESPAVGIESMQFDES